MIKDDKGCFLFQVYFSRYDVLFSFSLFSFL